MITRAKAAPPQSRSTDLCQKNSAQPTPFPNLRCATLFVINALEFHLSTTST